MQRQPSDRQPRHALVLDLGSGDNPHGRADVLCDRDPIADNERVGPLHFDRPLVVGDAQRLPFRSGAFDYVICSELINHVERPEEVLQELMRVAPAGYIDAASALSEKLGGFTYHRWFCKVEDGMLAGC